MKLTIITINYNNKIGLERTIQSVVSQNYKKFEYIVVDGKSTDGSVEVIKNYFSILNNISFQYISEEDTGIYNAMNKGILLAKGDYLQFLNSGDIFINNDVLINIINHLNGFNQIVYGNMFKPINNKIIIDKGFSGRQPTMLDFFQGTINHSPAFIHTTLFRKYGTYDESFKIVSDWKWYLNVVIFNNVRIHYVDLNITVFDMSGISSTNLDLLNKEKEIVLNQMLPQKILIDYVTWSENIKLLKRILNYPLIFKFVYFVERILFIIEKKTKIQKL